MDWVAVTKEERSEAAKNERLWKDKSLAATPLKTPSLVTRRAGSSGSLLGRGSDAGKAMGPGDRDLVNFLLGDDTATKEDPLDSILCVPESLCLCVWLLTLAMGQVGSVEAEHETGRPPDCARQRATRRLSEVIFLWSGPQSFGAFRSLRWLSQHG